ncbi:hypothetical protein [Nonomuraea cavernae]|uniref:Sporulation protein n=1 Tax=Nonomuraea cavernae TaxID=2045107 RepID=A0A917YXM2_9ACTN|nr:hypothetical protein [Nonomuraea cavernae]MCA2186954.1 hypothetical protein [Nonomuraea cavernae]GGO67081.1 hypothetical protein GCM10012289_22650 [Nonomuraea cavernae]
MNVREPNHQLAAVMARADCSNKGLARRVQDVATHHGTDLRCDHVSVKRWLDGMHPRGLTPHFIAEALSRKLGEQVSVREIGMRYAEATPFVARKPRQAGGLADGVTILVSGDLSANPQVVESEVSSDAWNDSMVTWLVNPVPIPRPLAEQRLITAASVEAVRETTGMFAKLDYRFGGGHARSTVVQYIAMEVEPLLKHVTPDTALGKQFLSETAAMLRLAAWMAYDTGRHGLAQRYMTRALLLAREAGNRMLGGRILAGMSHQANYLGHYGMAVNLARAARMGADGAATPTAMALFNAMEARALASQGDEAGCCRALGGAERWFERRNSEDDPVWLTYFDEAELAAEFAHCFRDLGHHHRARDRVLESVTLSESLYVRSLSFVRTILATSHVAGGDLEQGIAVAREVVATVADLRSTRTRRYVQEFMKQLARYGNDPLVREFQTFAETRLARARSEAGAAR